LTLSGAVPVDAASSQIDSGTRLPIQTSTLNTLLPFFLLTSIGSETTGSSTGGGLFGGDANSIMLPLLLLTLGR
jgi:hypothetical protein